MITWADLSTADQRLIAFGALGPPAKMPSGRVISREDWIRLGGQRPRRGGWRWLRRSGT